MKTAGIDKLNENSPIPLYFQLQEILRKKIREGEYLEGMTIPSEAELQKTYGVSRITVRNAIEGLVFEDLLIRKQGVGTIVASRRMVEDFSSLKSFTEKMSGQGVSIHTKVIDARWIGASERIAEHLQIEPEERILNVTRLRYVEKEPIALFSSYLPGRLGIAEDEDFSKSMYWLLENEYGCTIAGGEKIIEAVSAEAYEAGLLEIRPGDCVLFIRNTTIDPDGTPLEYAEGIYRSDRYKYVVKLKR
jgi:GntR family transcriptional regulator